MTVSDSVKKFFDTSSNLFTFAAVLSFIAFIICTIGCAIMISQNHLKNENEDKEDADLRSWTVVRKYSLRTFYLMLPLSLITWFGYMATPTKTDCLLIVAGGAVGNFITTDSSAKQLPADVTKFLHISLQNQMKDLSADVKRTLGAQTPKEKLLDKVKSLSKEELINYLQNDSTLAK